MKIESSSISMFSKTFRLEAYRKHESLRVWSNNNRPAPETQLQPNAPKDILEVSDEAKALLAEANTSLVGLEEDDLNILDISDEDKHKLLIIQELIEALTGKRLRFLIPKKLKVSTGGLPQSPNIAPSSNKGQTGLGWGLQYNFHESYYERQDLSFQAGGVVKTADGREIDFSVQLKMSREFYSESTINVRAGDAAKIDPLVINFDSPTAQLTDAKYEFDLDLDGNADQMSFVANGSGFLALDKNSDGRINDGSELFGPNTGDGFSELAAYDSDGNNWIDENDPIYEKLRIWTKDADGNDVLFALGQKGVGAIYLGNVNTDFNLKSSDNGLQGTISKTGIYLKENGVAGTIQHVDLAV